MRMSYVTIEETYEQMAELAQGQVKALMEKFEEIRDPEDPSDEAPEALQGITQDKNGRAMLVFRSQDAPRQRSIVYVDAIMDLADLLRRERCLPLDKGAASL